MVTPATVLLVGLDGNNYLDAHGIPFTMCHPTHSARASQTTKTKRLRVSLLTDDLTVLDHNRHLSGRIDPLKPNLGLGLGGHLVNQGQVVRV